MGYREDWERVLFELVPDEVVQDALNEQYMALEAETARLQERVGFMGLGTHAELVRVRYEMKGMREEDARLRELCREMFKEHQRIFHAVSPMRTSATSTQMAHWYDELWRLGVKAEG